MRITSVKDVAREIVHLDELDEQILGLLCVNARMPLNKIAKILKVSRQNVHNRFTALVNAGVIMGAKAVINRKLFDCDKVHYFTRKKPKDDPLCNAALQYAGEYLYEVSYICDVKQARSRAKHLKPYKEVIISQVQVNHPFPIMKISLESYRNDSSFMKDFTGVTKKIPIDSIDAKLLLLLADNAWLTLTQLGREVDLTYDAVRLRLRKLIQHGYISRFVPDIDYQKMGYLMSCILIEGKLSNTQKTNGRIIWLAESEDTTIVYLLHYTNRKLLEFTRTLHSRYTILVRDSMIKYRYISDYILSFVED